MLLQVQAGQEHRAVPGRQVGEAGSERDPEVKRTEELQRDHRVGAATLDQHEGDQGRDRKEQAGKHNRVGEAGLAAVDESVDQRGQANQGERLPVPVERRDPARRRPHGHQEDQHPEADRDVDVEDPPPVDGGEDAAQQRPGRRGDGPADRPHAERPGAGRGVRELLADQRHRRRQHESCGQALDAAGRDQRPDGRCEAADQRGDGEEHHSDRVRAPGAPALGEVAGQQQGGGEAQRVAIDHPLLPDRATAQFSLQLGQRDVDDQHVEGDKEEPQGGDGQRGPRPSIRCGQN